MCHFLWIWYLGFSLFPFLSKKFLLFSNPLKARKQSEWVAIWWISAHLSVKEVVVSKSKRGAFKRSITVLYLSYFLTMVPTVEYTDTLHVKRAERSDQNIPFLSYGSFHFQWLCSYWYAILRNVLFTKNIVGMLHSYYVFCKLNCA